MSDSKKNSVDKELKAIQEVIEALSGLDSAVVSRVLKYSLEHLGITFTLPGVAPLYNTPEARIPTGKHIGTEKSNTPTIDIKTLKESKRPSSGIEMAVLVGYYLSELAPDVDKKSEFGVKDAEKYFKQAHYKLPPKMHLTLNNAKNAGYVDSAGHGKFKLNPVGYNLAVHNLPTKSSKK